MATPKTPHLYLIPGTTHCYLHAMLTIKLVLRQRVFKAADWSGLYGKILHM